MHPLADPRLEPLVAAIRARGGDFVRAPGARPTVTLGTGNAVFMGGISMVDPGGGARVLRAAQSIWIWPALIGGGWALTVSLLALVVDGPTWLILGLVGLVTVILGPVALLALVLASRGTRRRLVIDGRSRTLDELLGARTVLRIPADLMRAVRVQTFENGDGERVYEVMVHLGFADLWIHQEGSSAGAAELAQTLAATLGVRFDPEVLDHG